jgi:signal transduction histidine kinase
MESLSDPAPLWTALGEWGSSSEAFVAAAGDRRIPSPLHQAGATSVLCIPLRFEGEALGAILADRGGEVFQLDAAARVVASILGSGTAIAMANARLYHKAMAASEEKSTFLARIAHDLRNPLHSMLWDLDTLEREGRGPHAVIDRLRQNAHMTLRGAEELQEFSEIETRRLTMHNEDVSLPRIFDELRITATALLAERPVAFRSRVARDARILRTDPVRLRQVLGNLLSNAVKFTIRGEVRLEAVRSGEHIVISVSDTGVGIEADEVREIFTPFYRGSARSTAARGMGLGLAIAQEIAGFLGGRIEVRSTVGAGSTFSVALPVRASAAGVAGEQQRDAGGRRSAA